MKNQTISNNFLALEYTTSPLRINKLTPKGKANIFADLSHMPPIPTPHGDFHFHGGHRLWHAPESMPRTYAPDQGELTITPLDDGVSLETQTQSVTGIRKRIDIRLGATSPTVRLTHTLTNNNAWTVELAPWAITQMRLGGTVILPMPTENVDEAGLLPNLQLSFWSYADLTDPRLTLQNYYTFFKADPAPAFKLGYFNPQGWLAYWINGVLFKKTFTAQTDATYPDNNSNAEIYCNEDFVELESLAPFVSLAPGATATHVEEWEISNSLPPHIQDALNKI